MQKYVLPELSFNFSDLKPYISDKQLELHYEKHHKSYVDKANAILEKIENARKGGLEFDVKSTLKSLSYNIGGHVLHSLFWENLGSEEKTLDKPNNSLKEVIDREFSSFERFKKEFSETALSIEGSGWAVLAYCKKTNRPLLMQIEKHNQNIYPGFNLLLVLDMWEHAYYLDYQNQKKKFVDSFWKIVDWEEVSDRLEETIEE